MKSKLTRLFVFVCGVTMLVSMVACGPTAEEDEALKVAFVYDGPVGDHGYNYSHDQGRKAVEEEYGDQVDVTTVEDVPEADLKDVIDQLIGDGYEYIVGNTFAFGEPMQELAEEHPDRMFVHCASALITAENMTGCWGNMYEGQYLQGILSGHMTESDIIGYVAPHSVPSVVNGINAFTLGAQSVNPDVEVRVVLTDAWHDPPREREAAMSVIDVGSDVVAHAQDSPAVPQAAEERGVYTTGYNQPAEDWAPESVLSSTVWNWPQFYVEDVGNALDGTWEARQYFGTLADGHIQVTDPSDLVTEEARAEFQEAREAIISGELEIFEGPLYDVNGELLVEEGEALTGSEPHEMTTFVEGVQVSQ